MATIDRIDRNRIAWGLAGLLTLMIIVVLVRGMLSTPQLGTDEEVFRTVDALFTAVNSRNKSHLEDSAQRLKTYRESGKLPATAAKKIDAIIDLAKADRWSESAHQLYDFMLAQRR